MNARHLNDSVKYIREQCSLAPRIGVILGSGLGDFAETLPNRTAISTTDIPHYPVSTVEGHKGRLVFATLNGKPLLAFQGRKHLYETRDLTVVLYPIHVAHALGIKTLIITNAAGGVNRNFVPGDLMILSDQINFTLQRAPSSFAPLAPRKPIYTPALIAKAEQAARASGISVRKGLYAGLRGPSYETASEIEMLARLGADAVGMSTVFEASLAASLGMDVLGISCITNLGTGISATKLDHAEVTEAGNRVKPMFAALLSATIDLID